MRRKRRKRAEPPVIACWGFYGERNVGDDYILYELLRFLQKRQPAAEIWIFSNSRDVLRLVPAGMEAAVLPRSVRASFSACRKADLVVCGPGGLFPHRNTGKLLFWNLLLAVSKLWGHRMAFIGLGVGSENFRTGLGRFLLRNLIVHADGFAARQQGVKAGVRLPQKREDRLVEAGDVLFGTKPPERRPAQAGTVAVALADIFGDAATERKAFLKGLSGVLNELTGRGYALRLLTFTDRKDDRFSREALEYLDNPDAVRLSPFPEHPADILKELGSAEVCICMRFHALVLASCLRVPGVAIAYSDKLDDAAERLGLSDYLVRVCIGGGQYYRRRIAFDADRFRKAVYRALAEKAAIRQTLDENVPQLAREADRNWAVLDRVLTKMKGSAKP
ncbi:MAG TPA: polysaccharide pyruvyl transferase family protein [Firmicutes bacterium]|nr:polysaccharide pyruvyl transferase family protein [Bacillota bacterium]